MNIKEIKPVTVVYKEVKTNLLNLTQYVGTEPDKLMKKVEEVNMEVVSPQIWEYIDVDGDPETEFTLRIGIPVKKQPSPSLTNIKELEGFKCATIEHLGSWDNLKHSYEKIIGEIMKEGYQLTNYCREVYLNCDHEKPENNITEIQVGIK